MNLDSALEAFAAGRISRDDLKKQILQETFIEAGCAKIDHMREARTGGPEVVFKKRISWMSYPLRAWS